jgi:hypothetical protein
MHIDMTLTAERGRNGSVYITYLLLFSLCLSLYVSAVVRFACVDVLIGLLSVHELLLKVTAICHNIVNISERVIDKFSCTVQYLFDIQNQKDVP